MTEQYKISNNDREYGILLHRLIREKRPSQGAIIGSMSVIIALLIQKNKQNREDIFILLNKGVDNLMVEDLSKYDI